MFRHSILILLSLLTLSTMIIGQSITNHGETSRVYGHGVIGEDFKISIMIDFIPRVIYERGCYIGRYDQVIGFYNYDRFGINITLIGERKELVENRDTEAYMLAEDSLYLYEVDSAFNRIAVLQGLWINDQYSGIWKSLKKGNSLPFKIEMEHHSFSFLNYRVNYRNYPLIGKNSNLNQNEIEVIRESIINDTAYLLVKITTPCCGMFNCRGSSCGGSEMSLNLYTMFPGSVSCSSELIRSECSGYVSLEGENIKDDIYTISLMSFIYSGKENETPDAVLSELIVDLKDLKKGFVKNWK